MDLVLTTAKDDIEPGRNHTLGHQSVLEWKRLIIIVLEGCERIRRGLASWSSEKEAADVIADIIDETQDLLPEDQRNNLDDEQLRILSNLIWGEIRHRRTDICR